MQRVKLEPERRRRRRVRSPHPGVVLVAPGAGRTDRAWQARWQDPDRPGKTVSVSLGPRGLDRRTHEQRVEWAMAKSRALKARVAALASGEVAAGSAPIAQAVEDYLKSKALEGKPRTVRGLRGLLRDFVDWAAGERGLATTADLRGPHIHRYRDHVLGLRRMVPKKGQRVGKGARVQSKALLSPGTRNGYLSAAQRFLNHARRRGLLSLSSDAIADALKQAYVETKKTIFKDSATIQRLLQAAIRRDRAQGEAVAGPFTLLALLMGARVGEILKLDWSQVSLDGTGVIEFEGYQTKTGRRRRVDLRVSPSLKALLSALWLRAGRPAKGLVMAGINEVVVRKDLLANYGVPLFKWKYCRSTCGSYLACAPGCGYTLPMVADRLGHDINVCTKHYMNAIHGIAPTADTLEKAMGIEAEAGRVVAAVGGDSAGRHRSRAVPAR